MSTNPFSPGMASGLLAREEEEPDDGAYLGSIVWLEFGKKTAFLGADFCGVL